MIIKYLKKYAVAIPGAYWVPVLDMNTSTCIPGTSKNMHTGYMKNVPIFSLFRFSCTPKGTKYKPEHTISLIRLIVMLIILRIKLYSVVPIVMR